jgi:hypothetical protein
MNKFFDYFLKKYSYSVDDLVHVFGDEYNYFYKSMSEQELLDPKTEDRLSTMEKKIDSFMDDMIYHNRRRHRG